ncbi:hypothetical protein LTR37_018441 [Vermiconidia calcicola]|uniref:Uncharacterized protein n=1 Tax=Vermiconidia calcicola TaxID=1690605 RepID=A0ACC3MH45_9PEZI|nr:hypothetical protein LTR37_018441 [Vermiconidia calcicola]
MAFDRRNRYHQPPSTPNEDRSNNSDRRRDRRDSRHRPSQQQQPYGPDDRSRSQQQGSGRQRDGSRSRSRRGDHYRPQNEARGNRSNTNRQINPLNAPLNDASMGGSQRVRRANDAAPRPGDNDASMHDGPPPSVANDAASRPVNGSGGVQNGMNAVASFQPVPSVEMKSAVRTPDDADWEVGRPSPPLNAPTGPRGLRHDQPQNGFAARQDDEEYPITPEGRQPPIHVDGRTIRAPTKVSGPQGGRGHTMDTENRPGLKRKRSDSLPTQDAAFREHRSNMPPPPRRPAQLPPAARNAGFIDPYTAVDIAAGRKEVGSGVPDPRQAPEYNHDLNEPPSKAKQLIRDFFDGIQDLELTREDVDALYFEGMSRQRLENNVAWLNVLGAHNNAPLYNVSYLPAEYDAANKMEVIDNLRPGDIFKSPITESLHDGSVALEDKNRMNSNQGAGIVKNRTCLCISPGRNEIEARSFTAFGNTGKPPNGSKEKFVRVVHMKNATAAEKYDDGIRVVAFDGPPGLLPKKSFMQFERPVPVNPQSGLVKKVAELRTEDYKPMADLMGLGKDHEFRKKGEWLVDAAARESNEEIRKERYWKKE